MKGGVGGGGVCVQNYLLDLCLEKTGLEEVNDLCNLASRLEHF
jgi:hypothetical protein